MKFGSNSKHEGNILSGSTIQLKITSTETTGQKDDRIKKQNEYSEVLLQQMADKKERLAANKRLRLQEEILLEEKIKALTSSESVIIERKNNHSRSSNRKVSKQKDQADNDIYLLSSIGLN